MTDTTIAAGAMREHLEQLTLNNAHVGGFAWHTDEDVCEMTDVQKELMGLTHFPDLVPSSEVFSRVHERDFAPLNAAIDHARENDEDYEAEFRYERSKGDIVWLGARGRFVEVEGRDSPTLVGVNFDITSIKQSEHEAKALVEQLRTELASCKTKVMTMIADADAVSGSQAELRAELEKRVGAMG